MKSSTSTAAALEPPKVRRATGRKALVDRNTVEGYLFILPFLSAYLLFLIYPFLKGLWMSLHEWNLLAVAFNPDAKRFVGLANYLNMLGGEGLLWSPWARWLPRLTGLLLLVPLAVAAVRGRMKPLTVLVSAAAVIIVCGLLMGLVPGEHGFWNDTRFWPIVGNTLLFVLFTVPLVTVTGLGLAVLLNSDSGVNSLFRTIFFLSQVLSVTVVTLIWQLLYSPAQGILGSVMRDLGMDPITWITNQSLAMPAIVIATVWWSSGLAMVIFVAGLQEIPAERYEAARLDGAGPWQILRNITLPALQRTTALVVVLQVILHFQVFGQVHLITRGGPGDSTQVLVRYIYQTAFRDSNLGYASALAMFLFVVMLIFSALQLRVSGERE